jgi:phenylalanyl-tRNA synthetase alpha chain
MPHEIIIDTTEEKRLRAELNSRTDAEALRMKRFLDMPDLSRTEGSPIREIAERVIAIPDFKDFDVLRVPEIVSAKESFDPFNFPANHPARSKSDTYYVNDDAILRTHTTVMWAYHLALPAVKEKMAHGEAVGAFSHGKVYRKDEIDRRHMNVFHQIDGWYLARKEEKLIGIPELSDVLVKIARAIYGPDVEYRLNEDKFPYTDPSLEMEIKTGDPSAGSGQVRWVEVLGSGKVHPKVLENFGVDSNVWNGWAFGFGLERLAIVSMNLPDMRLVWSTDERVTKQLKLGTTFKEVSKYPEVARDISFVVPNTFAPNNYFDLIRDVGGDLIEEVSLMDKYENAEKFGEGRVSYAYHIVYRSNDRTLTNAEVDALHHALEKKTAEEFGAIIR